MPEVARVGDEISTGHGCIATTTLDTPSQSTVFANGILICRVGDPTVAHPFPPDPPCADHIAQINAGSSTVFVAGVSVGRKGDSADADKITEGSPTVFAGG